MVLVLLVMVLLVPPRRAHGSAHAACFCAAAAAACSSSLGPLIAAAFLATLIGVGSANCVFLPVANRLKELSEEEMHYREMTLEGILAIQAGDNPRVVAEKLMAYVPPSVRPTEEEQEAAKAAAAAKQAA